jgi:hypothetical protein
MVLENFLSQSFLHKIFSERNGAILYAGSYTLLLVTTILGSIANAY